MKRRTVSELGIPGLVSVVIPTYNAANYLRESIQSVVAQSYDQLEVIVVDDGSTDDTREVCREWESVRYIYQHNDGSKGAGARARGIREARGSYIALQDHDDRWLPGKLEKQMAVLASDPEVGAVYSRLRHVDPQGLPTGGHTEVARSGQVYHDLLTVNNYYASSALIRRAALENWCEYYPDGTIRHPGDWALALDIAYRYALYYIEEPLVEYRVHRGNSSRELLFYSVECLKLLVAETSRFHRDCRECHEAVVRGYQFWRRMGAKANLDECQRLAICGDATACIPFLMMALRHSTPYVLWPRRLGATVKHIMMAPLRARLPYIKTGRPEA